MVFFILSFVRGGAGVRLSGVFDPTRKRSEGRTAESSLVFVTWCNILTKPQVQRYVLPFQAVPPLCCHTPCSASRSLWLSDCAPSLTAHKVCPDTPTRICKSSLLTCALCLLFCLDQQNTSEQARPEQRGCQPSNFLKAGFRLYTLLLACQKLGMAPMKSSKSG